MDSILKVARTVRSGEGEALGVLGTELRFLCDAADTAGRWSLMEVSVPRDAGPPPHDHDWDEAYYVTAGTLEFTLGDRVMRVGAGDFLYAPGGTPHAFRGMSDEPARVLIFDAPAHSARFFRAIDREVRSPADLPKIPEIGQRNGVRFRPPA